MILLKACFNIKILTMDFEISETNKGKKSLIYESFVFRIDNVLSTIIPINLSHSHDIDEWKVESHNLVITWKIRELL